VFLAKDRVKETSTTTGTGTYSLAGAVAGFRGFLAAGFATGDICTYVAEDGVDWECGIGTFTDAAPDTLARTIILASSNAGAAVNWLAGTRNIFCDYVAQHPPVIVKELTADVTSTSTTMAKVTGLDQRVEVGLWWFEYRIVWQTTATGTAIKLGVNFSGTQTRFVAEATGSESTTAASTGLNSQVHTAFGLKSGGSSRAPSTTVSLFGPTATDAANANMLAIIKGVIRVTVAGDLQLYFGSEAIGSTQTCESDSSLRLTRMG
jgi:hypothetical protein